MQGKSDQHAQRIRFNGEGVFQGEAMKFELTGGDVRELRDSTAAYPLSATLVAATTSIAIDGTMLDPALLKGLDVTVTIKGNNAADLFPLTGIALPPTPPYKVTGKLDYRAEVWRFRKFSGRLGDSDLAGNLSWDVHGKRPLLIASFISRKLDLDDLAGLPGLGKDSQCHALLSAMASNSLDPKSNAHLVPYNGKTPGADKPAVAR